MKAAETREFFNRLAEEWDSRIRPDFVDRLREILAELPLREGASVLDVGTGTGIALPFLLGRVGVSGSVTAVDLSERMLEVARSKLSAPNLHYVRADVASLPFLDESFDLVLCNSCFPHFHDRESAVSEMYRVLRPGGMAVVCHPESREEVNAVHRKTGGPVRGHLLPEGKELEMLFLRLGFRFVEITDQPDRFVLKAVKPLPDMGTSRRWGARMENAFLS
jgi:ubiquinone/menaquinone biosynthesis C-methylase UbiE